MHFEGECLGSVLLRNRGLPNKDPRFVGGIINPMYPFGHESVDDLPRKWSWSVARLPWGISGAHHGAETIKLPAKMGTYIKDHNWLVVWNMNFMPFHSVGNFIIPTDELIFFRGGGSTTNRIIKDGRGTAVESLGLKIGCTKFHPMVYNPHFTA